MVRTISIVSGTRIQAFRDAVRLRDRRCIISGEVAPVLGGRPIYTGFEAAHIFPLAYEGHWKNHNYDSWITIPPEQGGTINSVQNGLLLRSDIHQHFDSYNFSINPDVCVPCISYKYIVANNYLRTIIRSCSLCLMVKISPVGILIKNFLIALNDLLMRLYVGTSGRPF